MHVDTVIFDFGGVLADEGFEKGLRAIASKHGLDEMEFFNLAHELIHTVGYLTGHAGEHAYWRAIRDNTGIEDDDITLRNEILSRFILRPWMFDIVKLLRASGIRVAILSDQTNWLDELNQRDDFFKYFDFIFNSYHLGKSKMEPSHFSDTASHLGSVPERLLFVDDNSGHCERARKAGLKAIQFTGRESFTEEIAIFCPFLQ
jgi:putative hydrolase of the HAD superfamily